MMAPQTTAGWIGIFNRDGKIEHTVQLNLKELGLVAGGEYSFKELWTRTDVPQSSAISFTIPADDCVFLSYQRK